MNTFIQLIARAKINLSLDVLRKRQDGYHDLKMIMQTIELHDKIYIEAIPNGIEVECNLKWVPSGSDNIAYKAADLLRSEYGIRSGFKIKIEKCIPVAAGLAGGSSDAAAVLKGINKLQSLGLHETDLMRIGKQVGADVPYCIRGGTMLAEGIGEVLTELPLLSDVNIVLVKPKVGVSTAWVYKNLDPANISEKPDTELLISAINANNIEVLAKNMKNVLENVTVLKHPIIEQIKKRLVELGALGSMMSGSGPTVFGIFEDKHSAECALKEIKKERLECYLTKTV